MHRRDVPLTRRCEQRWEELSGRGRRRRHCESCDREVINLSAMRQAEARAFLAAVRGPVCLAYRHAPDGQITLAPDVPAERLSRRRAPRWVGVAAAASLAACATPVPVSAKARPDLIAKCDRLFPEDAEPQVVEVVAPDPAPPLAQDVPSVDCELARSLQALGGYGVEVPEACD